MSDGSKVSQYGTDRSGRPVLMSAYLNDWWEGVVAEVGFRPPILQGSWMSLIPGGGADASAGFHDEGGPLDVRTRDLTLTQKGALIHAIRWGGGTGWIRDTAHGGFDEHCHLLLGTDFSLSQGSAWQWLNYIHGGDGLGDGSGRDYHPRPDPIPLKPPDRYLRGLYDMTPEEVRAEVEKAVKDAAPALAAAVWEHVVREADKSKGVTEQSAEAALKKAANR